MQIVQELALTRVAFEGSLTIFNEGDTPLTNISVTLKVTRPGEEENLNHLFVFGDPDPVFQGGVDGNGRVAAKSEGTSTWLFMALREAAPVEATAYEIGGFFVYYDQGVRREVTLFPDTITVEPDPALHVKYFWERDVYSDDPFTEEIEPAVPFASVDVAAASPLLP